MPKPRPARPIRGNYRDWPSLAAYREDARQMRRLIRLVRDPGGPTDGLRLYSAMRNERDLLPLFLRHYRALGIARFVIIDNDSSDGTRELLLDEPDVELHHTTASYADANGGTLWIDALIEEQARDRWVVHADADELLVYDGCERHALPALAERLTAAGESRLLGPLLDVYSRAATPDDLLFDALPERSHDTGGGPNITGGPRARMAAMIASAQSPCLTKYPLLRYGPRAAFVNVHFPEPGGANGHRVQGRLVHLKLTPRFRGKVAEALREGQHWNDASEYRGYADWLAERDTGDLVIAESRPYRGPPDLIAVGLLEPIDWRRSRLGLRLRRLFRGQR